MKKFEQRFSSWGGDVATNNVNSYLENATRGTGLRLRDAKLTISDNPLNITGTDIGIDFGK